MTAEELLQRYAAGERDFSRVDLSGARLRDTELPGINLSEANLFGAKLDRASLSGANFSGANLGSAWLEGANLSGANFSNAVISDGVLSETDLSGANLSYADLTACPLDGANLSGADLTGTLIGNEPLLKGTNLTDVDLSQSEIDLPGGIENPRIEGAIFCNTTLPDGTRIINFF
jgi:uncharacterized protein YjbI with pentapeptide repeats